MAVDILGLFLKLNKGHNFDYVNEIPKAIQIAQSF